MKYNNLEMMVATISMVIVHGKWKNGGRVYISNHGLRLVTNDFICGQNHS